MININKIFQTDITIASSWNLVLPIGISFYTFQSLGYLIDVYRNNISAEKNFIKYALFVSYFPVILSGPIERAKNLLKQINEPTSFDVEKVRKGLLTFAYGLFLKLVVADRIAVFINPIFNDYSQHNGMFLLLAVILYSFQIYFDFLGYSQMALGSGLILGHKLCNNFHSPYFSLSVSEFWRRWHISLTSWFRDYLYIPLGGNRKGKLRKHINTMIVFLTSGLWHGAGWNFIFWGSLNGFYIVFEDLISNKKKHLYRIIGIKSDTFVYKCFARLLTFVLVAFSWLFFRANSFRDGLDILAIIIMEFKPTYIFSEAFWNIFSSKYDFIILFVSLIIALFIDYLNYNGINMNEKILQQRLYIRWGVYLILIFIILLWGAYGGGYEQTQFIYFQF